MVSLLPKDAEFLFDRCANCGCRPVTIFDGFSLYDGEGVCSKECLKVHDKMGCPLEDMPMRYRDCPHAPSFIMENIQEPCN